MCHRPEVSQQQLNKQLVIAVLEDTQRLQLLQLDLSALTVAESVLRTSVSAVIFVSTYDRTSVQCHRRKRLLQGSKQWIDLIVQCSLEFSGTTGSVHASDETEFNGTTGSVHASDETEFSGTTGSVHASDETEFSGTTGSVHASDETESVWLWVMSLCWVKLSPVVGIVKLMTRLVQKHSHCQSLVHACVLSRAPACYCLMMRFPVRPMHMLFVPLFCYFYAVNKIALINYRAMSLLFVILYWHHKLQSADL